MCVRIYAHRAQSALIICTLTFQSLIEDLVYIAVQIMAVNKMDTSVFPPPPSPVAQFCGLKFMSDCALCIYFAGLLY